MPVPSSSPVPSSTSSSLITSNLLGSAREGGKMPVAGSGVMRRLGPWISPSRRARPSVRAAMPPAWRPGLVQPPRCRFRRRGVWGPRGGRDTVRRECSPGRRGHRGTEARSAALGPGEDARELRLHQCLCGRARPLPGRQSSLSQSIGSPLPLALYMCSAWPKVVVGLTLGQFISLLISSIRFCFELACRACRCEHCLFI